MKFLLLLLLSFSSVSEARDYGGYGYRGGQHHRHNQDRRYDYNPYERPNDYPSHQRNYYSPLITPYPRPPVIFVPSKYCYGQVIPLDVPCFRRHWE